MSSCVFYREHTAYIAGPSGPTHSRSSTSPFRPSPPAPQRALLEWLAYHVPAGSIQRSPLRRCSRDPALNLRPWSRFDLLFAIDSRKCWSQRPILAAEHAASRCVNLFPTISTSSHFYTPRYRRLQQRTQQLSGLPQRQGGSRPCDLGFTPGLLTRRLL